MLNIYSFKVVQIIAMVYYTTFGRNKLVGGLQDSFYSKTKKKRNLSRYAISYSTIKMQIIKISFEKQFKA